jgi:hypothetical protein
VLRSVPSSSLPVLDGVGSRYLSTGAFSESSRQHDRYQGMSVTLEHLLLAQGLAVELAMLPGHEALVGLNVGALRDRGFQVGWDPRPENLYHGQVWGVKKNRRQRIHDIREWIRRPPDVQE